MAGPNPRRPVLALEWPQQLGVFDKYEDAQKAVDHLSDKGFPVENCMIVGTDLKQVERVTGRLTYAKAAGAGAMSGAWFGLLVGLLFSAFGTEGTASGVLLSSVLIGVAFGIVWGLAGYAFTGGRRDFTSVSQVVATRYEVLVEHRVLARAQELLAQMPGRPVPPL